MFLVPLLLSPAKSDLAAISLFLASVALLVSYPPYGWVGEALFVDKLSLYLALLSAFLTGFVFFLRDKGKKAVLAGLAFVLLFLFAKKILWMYVAFELSMVPMIWVVASLGLSPERFQAAKVMTMYTLVSSAPLLMGVLWIFDGCDDRTLLEGGASLLHHRIMLAWMSVAFLVKVPLFLFHSWLPLAHVEAPLIGSVFLAGVMLKVGLYGFIRILSFGSEVMFTTPSFLEGVYALSLLGSVLSLLCALSSDDLKVSVAYSSISHMNISIAAVCSGGETSLDSATMIMISHGLTSPILFFLVYEVYDITHSRSVVLGKGSVSKFPLMKGLFFIHWVSNMSVPPSLSFLGELGGAMAIMHFCKGGWFFLSIFILLGSFFSIINYVLISHSGKKLLCKSLPRGGSALAAASFVWVSLSVSLFFSWSSL